MADGTVRERDAGTTRRGGGPRRLSASLLGVTRPAFADHGFWEAAVLTEWPAIVGATLASWSCPEKLGRDGNLTVRVAGGHALEVQHLEPVILDRIAGYFGYRAVRRLSLRQGPLPPVRGSEAASFEVLTADQESSLASAVGEVRDPELRRALETLGRAVLGRR